MFCRVNKYQSSDSHGDVESFLIKRGNFLQDVLKSLRLKFHQKKLSEQGV